MDETQFNKHKYKQNIKKLLGLFIIIVITIKSVKVHILSWINQQIRFDSGCK